MSVQSFSYATVQSMLTLWFRKFHSITPLPEFARVLAVAANEKRPSEIAFIRVFHDFHFGRSLVNVALRLNCPIRFPHHHSCLIQRTILIRAEEFTFRLILVITNPKFSIFCRNRSCRYTM